MGALSRIMKYIFAFHSTASLIHDASNESHLQGSSCWKAWIKWVQYPVHRIVEHNVFVVFFLLLTTYALFGPDLVNNLGNSDHEIPFMIVNTVVFVFLVIEIVLHSAGLNGYVLTVSFFLDIIAVLSIL